MADKQEKNPNVYEKKTVFEAAGEEIVRKAYDYATGYVKFMDSAKTEREAVVLGIKMAEAAGYRPYRFGDKFRLATSFTTTTAARICLYSAWAPNRSTRASASPVRTSTPPAST